MFREMIRQKSFGLSVIIFGVLLLAPSFLPRFYVYFLAVIFVTALLAMSLNLCVGHGMIFQFHHGVFYGVGAYTAGLLLAKTSLPWWVAFMAGPLVAAFAGLLIGIFCIRLRPIVFRHAADLFGILDLGHRISLVQPSPGAMTGFTASRSLILSHPQPVLITLF